MKVNFKGLRICKHRVAVFDFAGRRQVCAWGVDARPVRSAADTCSLGIIPPLHGHSARQMYRQFLGFRKDRSTSEFDIGADG